MQYIVMDMEWNNAYSKKLGAFVNEIIEIGAVKLDDSLRVLDTFSVIIKSKIGKKLRGRVKTLTHLTNEDISNGIPFEDAFSQFENWVGPEDNVFLTWGDGDIRTLVKNCEYFLNGKKPLFIRHFADLQKYCQSYTDAAASGQQLGLSAAAEKLGIDPEAFPHHRALDDSKLSVVCLQKVFEPEKLKKFAINLHKFITDGENLDIFYSYENQSGLSIKDDLYQKFDKIVLKEIELGYTCIGPHRDDIVFKIDDNDCKFFASQGQQRTVALVVKLSLMEVIKQEIGEYPVLLLDDVMSELDLTRQDKLIELVSKYQTLITCTKIPDTNIQYNTIRIENGTKI